MADTGVWDLDELNAVDMQLASTPKAKKLSQRKKRGSLMSRIENQTPSNVETDENAAYKNRSSSVVIDSDDEEYNFDDKERYATSMGGRLPFLTDISGYTQINQGQSK